MHPRRVAFALAVAFLLSVAATYSFYVLSRRQVARQTPGTVKIVAARADLQAGTPLTSDNLVLVDWPQQLPISGSIPSIEQIAGRSLIYPVLAHQPILDADLAAAGSGIGLAVKIPDGMRAVSIKSNEVVGVAGFLYPGSRVDVLLTYHSNDPNPLTRTILQAVEVLTAGQKIEPDPQGKPESVNVVTLLLSPHDAEKLLLASSQGSVQFALRNGADQTTAQTDPATVAELLGNAAPAHVAAKTHSTAHAPAVAPLTTVELIAGGKHSAATFR